MKQKLKSALVAELHRLESVTAWQEDDGSYRLFGNYHVVPDKPEVIVVKNNLLEIRFATIRAAVTWCIADQHEDRTLALRVQQLDREIVRVRNDISTRQQIKGSGEFTHLIGVKLQPKIIRKHQLETEFNRCVRLAKRYQRGLTK